MRSWKERDGARRPVRNVSGGVGPGRGADLCEESKSGKEVELPRSDPVLVRKGARVGPLDGVFSTREGRLRPEALVIEEVLWQEE